VIIALVFSFLALLHFPGVFSIDDLMIYEQWVLSGGINTWNSISYSSWILFLHYVLSGFWGPMVVNLLAFFCLVWLAAQRINQMPYRLARTGSAFFLTVVCLSPYHQALVLTHNRDIPFSLILVSLSMIFLIIKKFKSWHFAFIGFFVCLLSDMRMEAKFLLVLFPLLASVFRLWTFRNFSVYLLWQGVWSLLFLGLIPMRFDYAGLKQPYQGTAFVNPLSTIYSDFSVEREYPELHEAISLVMDPVTLRRHAQTYNIGPAYFEVQRLVNDREFNRFKVASFQLYTKYPGTWLRNRIAMASSILNFGTQAPALVSVPYLNRIPEMLSLLNISTAMPLWNWSQRHLELIDVWMVPDGTWLHRIFCSQLLPLLSLLAGLVFFRRSPAAAFASSLLLGRMVLVLATAPANFFKYLLSVSLGGAILLPLLVAELLEYIPRQNHGRIFRKARVAQTPAFGH
jgi:hypothetical protein